MPLCNILINGLSNSVVNNLKKSRVQLEKYEDFRRKYLKEKKIIAQNEPYFDVIFHNKFNLVTELRRNELVQVLNIYVHC